MVLFRLKIIAIDVVGSDFVLFNASRLNALIFRWF